MVESTYIGQDYYTVNFIGGTHQVIRWEGPVDDPIPEVVFKGHYEKCMDKLEGIRKEWAESCY